MKNPRAICWLGWMLLATGCTSMIGPGVELGTGPEAVAAHEAYLEEHPLGRRSDEVRFQLAMIHLKSDGEAYDPAAARNLLWQLAGGAADPYREGASRVLELLTETERLRAEATVSARAVEDLRRETVRLRQAAELARGETAEKGEDAERMEQEADSLLRELTRVREQSVAQEEQIARLAMELRELKRIDTGQIP